MLKKNQAQGKPIEWILLTNMPVNNFQDAHDIIKAYSKRWHIENFHKILKTSFKLEEARLESFEALTILAATISILADRLYYMIHFARINPDAPCSNLMEKSEWKSLWIYLKKPVPLQVPTFNQAIVNIAIIAGYMNRKSDKPLGILLITRGWKILRNLNSLYLKLVGNR